MAQVTAIRQPSVQHDSRQALRTAIIIAIPTVALALYATSQEAWGALLASWPWVVAAIMWTDVSLARLRQEYIRDMASIDARREAILARQGT